MTNILAVASCLLAAALAADPMNDNHLAGALIATGVIVGDAGAVRLPPPTMPDGLDAAAQQRVIKELVGELTLDEFLRNSIVARHELKMESLTNSAGERVGQRVDLYFVAYGKVKTLVNKELIVKAAGVEQAPEGTEGTTGALPPEELAARGLKVEESDARTDAFVHVEFPILDRVQLSGVGYTMTTKGPNSIVAAARVDDRFANDPKWPNQWRPRSFDEVGNPVVGDPRPYTGLGGYMKVTELAEPAGALFVETHVVLAEPHDWFGGINQLGSKLPLAVQNNIRDFRRRLLKAEAEQGNAQP